MILGTGAFGMIILLFWWIKGLFLKQGKKKTMRLDVNARTV
jgi:hypothetical protein